MLLETVVTGGQGMKGQEVTSRSCGFCLLTEALVTLYEKFSKQHLGVCARVSAVSYVSDCCVI